MGGTVDSVKNNVWFLRYGVLAALLLIAYGALDLL